mgnify:CR=1 FL=1
MTKTRIYDFLRGFNPLYVAIALSMLMLAGIIMLKGAVIYNADSLSYISAWDDCYSQGKIDEWRTPVYPVIIGLGKFLLGAEYWEIFPTIVQIIVFYSCSIPFCKMAFNVISNRRVAWFTIFLFFLFYPIINTLPLLGTEALGFSLTSLWLYCVWRFMQYARWGYGISVCLLTITAIMLRPAFLILIFAIIGLFAVGIFMKNYRRQTLLLLLTLIPVGIVYKVYTNEMKHLIDLDTISIVSVYNTYSMARQYNDIFPELLADNPQAIAVMQEYHKNGDSRSIEYILKQWEEIAVMEDSGTMTYLEMNDYALAVKKEHPGLWLKNIGKRIIDSLTSQGPVKNACNYLVVTLYTVFFIVGWIRFRRFSLVNFLILMIGGGSLLSIFLYAQNDFGRLMLPTSAVLILMGGQLLNCIRLHPLSIKLRRMYPYNKNQQ